MSEETLAQPLSGFEVIKAISHEVERMLAEDCFLSPMMAYESFEAKITVAWRAKDCGREVDGGKTIEMVSETPVDDDAALVEAESRLFEKPPNEVRLESEQGVPTLVQTSDGRQEIKAVKYAKKIANVVKETFKPGTEFDI